MLVRQATKKIHVVGFSLFASAIACLAANAYGSQATLLATIALATILIFIAVWRHQLLLWPTRLWMTLNDWISITCFYVLLACLFFLVITPAAIVRRLRKIDTMNRQIDPDLASYKINSRALHINEIDRPY